MKYSVIVPESVRVELESAAEWYRQRSLSLEIANRWLRWFEHAIASLETNPDCFALAHESGRFHYELRELLYGSGRRKTHRALFRISGDRVELMAYATSLSTIFLRTTCDRMPHFVTERRIQFSETDMAGIVHFANFFRWMEEAEHEYFRSLGLTIVAKQDGAVHIGWPRVAASCNFHLPLFYQDVIEVRVTVERLGVKSISYQFELWRGDDHIATGRLKVACCLCGLEGIIRSIEIPRNYLERLPSLDA